MREIEEPEAFMTTRYDVPAQIEMREPAAPDSYAETWDAFQRDLKATLDALRKHQFLILEIHRTNVCVQFACGAEERWRMEATGDAYLPEGAKLGSEQLAALQGDALMKALDA